MVFVDRIQIALAVCLAVQSAVWLFRVVMFPPLFDQNLRLWQVVKGFPVEPFVTEACV